MKRFVILGVGLCMSASALFALSPAAGGATPGAGLPMVRDRGAAASSSGQPVISLNWSGYAVTSPTPFNYVAATFVQPAITCTGQRYFNTSNWVGLDGFNDQTVEQDGTAALCSGPTHTIPKYEAWYEMFPAASVSVFTVKPGDTMFVSVLYKSGKYMLTVSDKTSGDTFIKTAACGSCQRASAEWIIERAAYCGNPACNGFIIGGLPDFVTTTMSDDVASAGGAVTGIPGFANVYPIEGVYNLSDSVKMGNKGFISVDTVGPVSNTNSFKVTWDRSGKPLTISL